MPGELHDLDQWLADEASQAPSIRLYGETVQLPAEPPFDLILQVYRLTDGQTDQAEVDPELAMQVIAAMFGPDRVQRWREQGLGVRTATRVLNIALRYWRLAGDQPEAGGEEGEAAAPASGPSSNDGDSSSPTSSASTASTSTPNEAAWAGDGSGSSSPA